MSNDITVKIGGDATNLNQSVKKAEKELTRFQKVVGSLCSNMEKLSQAHTNASMMFVGLQSAGSGVASVISNLTSKYNELGTQLDLTSQRTNISVESLSKLKYAASQSGVQFETLTDAIKTFQEQLGAARLGDTGAIDKLGAVGIRAEDFEGLDEEQQFMKLAEHIANIGDKATKTRTAIELFGDSGYQLIPFFDQGEDGIRKMCDKAKELGLVMDENGAKKANEFGSALSSLKSAFDMVIVKVGEAFAPFILKATKFLEGFASVTGAIATKCPLLTNSILLFGSGLSALVLVAGAASMAVSVLSGTVTAFLVTNPAGWCMIATGALGALGVAFLGASKDAKTMESEVTKTANTIRETSKTIEEAATKTKKAYEQIVKTAELQKESSKLMEALSELAKKEKLSNDEKARAVEIMDKLNERYKDLNLKVGETSDSLGDLTSKQMQLIKIQTAERKAEYQKAFEAEVANEDNINRAMIDAKNDLSKSGFSKEGVRDWLRDIYSWDSSKLKEVRGNLASGVKDKPVAEQNRLNALVNVINARLAILESSDKKNKLQQAMKGADLKEKDLIKELFITQNYDAEKEVNAAKFALSETLTAVEEDPELKKREKEAWEPFGKVVSALNNQIDALAEEQELTGKDNSDKIAKLEAEANDVTTQGMARVEGARDAYSAEKNKQPELVEMKDGMIVMAENRVERKKQNWADAVQVGDKSEIEKAKKEFETAELELARIVATVTGRDKREAQTELESARKEYNDAKSNGADPKTLNELADKVAKADAKYQSKSNEYYGAISTLNEARAGEEVATVAAQVSSTSRGTFSAFGLDSLVSVDIPKQQLEQLKKIFEEVITIRKDGRNLGFVG